MFITKEYNLNNTVNRINNAIKYDAKKELDIEMLKFLIMNCRCNIDLVMIDSFMMSKIAMLKSSCDIQHVIRYHAQMDMINEIYLDVRQDSEDWEKAEDEYWTIDSLLQSFADRRIEEITKDYGIAGILDYEW